MKQQGARYNEVKANVLDTVGTPGVGNNCAISRNVEDTPSLPEGFILRSIVWLLQAKLLGGPSSSSIACEEPS